MQQYIVPAIGWSMVVSIIFIIGLFYLPRKQLYGHKDKGSDAYYSLLNEYRKTYAQIAGAIAAIFLFSWQIFQYFLDDNNRRQAEAYEYLTKTINLLSDEKVENIDLIIRAMNKVLIHDDATAEDLRSSLSNYIHSKVKESRPKNIVTLDRVDDKLNSAIAAVGDMKGIGIKVPYRFEGGYFVGAIFTNQKGGFMYESFKGSDMRAADFQYSNLDGAEFFGVNMNAFKAKFPNLESPELEEKVRELLKENTNHKNDWNDYDKFSFVAQFKCANLKNTKFKGADLSAAMFTRADLTSANFSEATLYKTDFSSSNLTDADFSNAKQLETANFSNSCVLHNLQPKWPKGFPLPADLLECKANDCAKTINVNK